MILQIILIIYIVLAGTVGAWWLAKGGVRDEVSLLDLIPWILPSILLIWILLPLSLLDCIKIKKFK